MQGPLRSAQMRGADAATTGAYAAYASRRSEEATKETGPSRRPPPLSAAPFVGEDERSCSGQHSPHPVHQRELRVRHLPRAALAAKLPCRFDDGKDAVHPAVRIREPAAIRVDR